MQPVVVEQAPWRPAFRDVSLILIGIFVSVVVEALLRWSDRPTSQA